THWDLAENELRNFYIDVTNEIRQYDQNSMKETFEKAGFKSISFSKSDHITPSNKIQKFIFGVFKNSN
ncbi:MAG: hypothetical protein CMC57_01895, partial [Flavobacteriaceae bacterium]|nr:hypothetical protein [Flavobacteriaceae bacterium]